MREEDFVLVLVFLVNQDEGLGELALPLTLLLVVLQIQLDRIL